MEGKTIESRSYGNTDGPENQTLLSHHLADLQRSGLNIETIESLGFYSGTAAEVKAILGFDAGPGLIIPYPCYGGQPFFRVKPDKPPIKDGKPLGKYLQAPDSMMRAYIPPRTWEALKNPTATVGITEGEKKSAKADQEGFPTIGLGGIWGFYQHHEFIPDLANITWEGRRVLLFPDSDFAVNNDVRLAFFTLEQELRMRGAKAEMVFFLPDDKGQKMALDDYLVINGREGLERLITEAKPCLYWEIHLMVALPEYERPDSLEFLFPKIARLEATSRLPWKTLCHDKLRMKASDFNLQVKAAEAKLAQRALEARIRRQEHLSEEEKARMEGEQAKLRPQALELLKNPALLCLHGKAVQRLGVAGEDVNIRVLILALTSRLEDDPLSITLKGDSSSGKSHTAQKTLQTFPPEAYLEMTGMSKQALVYSEEEISHRTLVIFERGGATAADYNIRTLQSEGKLIFEVAEKNPETNRWETRRVEKAGPTNFIFTTTSPELRPENETRHWSLIMDETTQQTRGAKRETAKRYGPTESTGWLAIWHQAQRELKVVKVRIPYAMWLADNTPDEPLRIRRDFNKLLALIEASAILHQYQREAGDDGEVYANLADYFIARELVDKVFPASLLGINQKVIGLVKEVEAIYLKKGSSGEENPSVAPREVAIALHVSVSSVSRWLRPAVDVGLVEVVKENAKGQILQMKPGLASMELTDILPKVNDLAEAFPELARGFSVIHPITGEEYTLEEETEKIFEEH